MELTPKDRMIDKLIAIESWAYRLRHVLTDTDPLKMGPLHGTEKKIKEITLRACTEIQYRFHELKQLAEKEGT
jgi:hypothetical protein